jgi:hypothetical protein
MPLPLPEFARDVGLLWQPLSSHDRGTTSAPSNCSTWSASRRRGRAPWASSQRHATAHRSGRRRLSRSRPRHSR